VPTYSASPVAVGSKARSRPLAFGHTLQDQIGGQLDAGLVLAGFYEDAHLEGSMLNDWLPTFAATRAIKA
jgi:hypothetical protein